MLRLIWVLVLLSHYPNGGLSEPAQRQGDFLRRPRLLFSPSPKLNIPGSWKVSDFRPFQIYQENSRHAFQNPIQHKVGREIRLGVENPLPENTLVLVRSKSVRRPEAQNIYLLRQQLNVASNRAREITHPDSTKFKYQNPEFFFPKSRLKRMNDIKLKTNNTTYSSTSTPKSNTKPKVETFFESLLQKSSQTDPKFNKIKTFHLNSPFSTVNAFPRSNRIDAAVQLKAPSPKDIKLLNHLYGLPNRRPRGHRGQKPHDRVPAANLLREDSLENSSITAKVKSCPKLASKAELTCSIHGYNRRHPITRIIWAKRSYSPDGSHTTILTENEYVRVDNPRLLATQPTSSSYNLIISPFRIEDIGTYECIVYSGDESRVAKVPLSLCF